MNVGQTGARKRSVLDFVFRGMQKVGRIFKGPPETQSPRIRKNSKSERVIMAPQNRFYHSDSSAENVSDNSGDEKDFSRELERCKITEDP